MKTFPGISDKPLITDDATRALPARNDLAAAVAAFRRQVWSKAATHPQVFQGVDRLLDLTSALVHRYQLFWKQWSNNMSKHSRAVQGVRTPAPLRQEPSDRDLEEAEAYFKHHEGVYIKDAQWDDEDLTSVIAADAGPAE